MGTDLDLRFQTVLAERPALFVVNPTGALERSDAVEDRLAGLRGDRTSTPRRAPASTSAPRSGYPVLGEAPGLRGPRPLVQHAGRPAADAGRPARPRGAGRLLDLHLHQLPAHPAVRPGLGRALRAARAHDRGRAHAGVPVRAGHRQRDAGDRPERAALPGAPGQRLRHVDRLGQPVLARQVPDRRAWPGALHALRRGRLRGQPRRRSARCCASAATRSPGAATRARPGEVAAAGTSDPGDLPRLRAGARLRARSGRGRASHSYPPSRPPSAKPVRACGRLARKPRTPQPQSATPRSRRASSPGRCTSCSARSGDRPRTGRVLLDGRPIAAREAGADVRAGRLRVKSQRLYRLVSLPRVEDRTLRLELPPGVTRLRVHLRVGSPWAFERTKEDQWPRRRSRGWPREARTARAGPIEVQNPATGEVIASVPALEPDQVAAVVARARAAQPGWEALGFDGRARVLRRAQKWVIDNADRIARTIMAENGKAYEDAQLAEVSYAAAAFGFWAKHAPKYLADEQHPLEHPVRDGPQARGALRAGRRGRRDRALELPAHQLVRRLHPGAGGRQLGGAQAREPHPAHLAADGGGPARVRPARGRLHRRGGRRLGGRGADRRGGLRDVHRLHRGRQEGDGARGAARSRPSGSSWAARTR